MSPYDCLLLQHILWQDPEQSERIREFLISQLAADERSIEQTDYLFKGTSLFLQRPSLLPYVLSKL